MKMIFTLYCFLTCFSLQAIDHLIFSVDLIRHGDRTPGSELQKSAYPWKEGLGNLTAQGVQQERTLGAQMRNEYQEKFRENLIYARSTDMPRTKESLKALFGTLFPGATIPIDSVKREDDDLLLVRPSRNPISFIKLYFFKRESWKEVEQKLASHLPLIRSSTGHSIEDLDDLDTLADILSIRQLHKIPLPKELTSDVAEKIVSLSEQYAVNLFKRDEVSEPAGRHFLDTVGHFFQEAKAKKTELKYVFYMGHDSSLMAVLNTLKVPFTERPPYASRLNFSLLRGGDGEYHVRMNYNGKDLVIGRCGGPICPLSQFLTI